MTSTVTCGYSGAAWEINSAGQDACQQYAALVGQCSSSFTVSSVTPSSPPYLPSTAGAACQCNVVAYNLQAACGWCQDAIQSTWWSTESSWAGNCTALSQTYNRSGLPASVNTASLTIPPWATATVNTFDDTWNPSRASQIAIAATGTGTGTATNTRFTADANTNTRFTFSSYTYSYGTDYPYGYDPYNLGGYVAASTGAVAIAAGVTVGIWALTAIIMVTAYIIRQKRRKAWYGPMAAYYRDNGVGGGPGYGAPLLFKNEPNVHGSPMTGHPSLPSTPYQPPPPSNDAYAGYSTPYGGTPAPPPGADPRQSYMPNDPRQSYAPPPPANAGYAGPPPPGGPGYGAPGHEYPPPPGTNPFNTPQPTPHGGPPPGAAGAHGYTGHAEVY